MEKRKTPEGVEQQLLELSDVLTKLPFSTVVRIGCAMNAYEWSDELPGKPDGWDEMSIDERLPWATPLYKYIRGMVGDKAMLRHFHKTEYGETDQEFEDWWESCSMYSTNHIGDVWQDQSRGGYTERNDSCNSQKEIVPFFLGASVGVLLFALLLNILKICGVL